MGTISGPKAKKLSDAIRHVFTPEELDRLLYYALDISRADITLASNYQTRVYDVIRAADGQGWIEDLMVAAREARPRDAALHELAEQLALTSAPVALERIVQENAPFVDISVWRERLGALEARVCRVEPVSGSNAAFGTGFLVGPDLVMTNHHVVKELLEGRIQTDQVVFRFDFRKSGVGAVLNPGTEYRLHHDHLVAASPPSGSEVTPGSGSRVPAAGELDFAVLRLEGAPGEEPISSGVDLSPVSVRGWIDQVTADPPSVGETLFVLQHPAKAPLKLGFGAVVGFNSNATRLLHRVNTLQGSSGSPCMNSRLQLVALHQSGVQGDTPTGKSASNRAVPINAICRYLAENSTAVEVFPAMPPLLGSSTP